MNRRFEIWSLYLLYRQPPPVRSLDPFSVGSPGGDRPLANYKLNALSFETQRNDTCSDCG